MRKRVSPLTDPSPRDLLLPWLRPRHRQVKWGRPWGQGQLQDPSVTSPLKRVEKAGAPGRGNGCAPAVVASGARPAPGGWDHCPGRARLQMGFQDGAGTSWDLLLIRSWGGQVYLCLSGTLSLLHGQGRMVAFWLGWGPQGQAQLWHGGGHQEP